MPDLPALWEAAFYIHHTHACIYLNARIATFVYRGFVVFICNIYERARIEHKMAFSLSAAATQTLTLNTTINIKYIYIVYMCIKVVVVGYMNEKRSRWERVEIFCHHEQAKNK